MGLPEQICPSYMMNRVWGDNPRHPAPRIQRGGPYRGKEVLRLINHDMIRELLVPSQDLNLYPAVIEKSEYERIKQRSQAVTIDEKIAKLQEEASKRECKMEACLNRRENLRKYDINKVERAVKQGGHDEEATSKANYALARAYELRQEEDDDIKQFNKHILSTKCHAIRDAQIVEKKLIEREIKKEEERLDGMMEQSRRKGLEREEEARQKDLARKHSYIQCLLGQIKENEICKVLEAQKLEDEQRKIQEAHVHFLKEEMELRKQEQVQKEKIKKDLNESNEQIKYFRSLLEEEEKVAEERAREFQQQKAKWEDQREKELKAQALAHNREFTKLWKLQEKQHDLQEQLNEVNDQRIQDEVERLWRCKEQEAVQKKHEENEQLKAERAVQIQDHRRMKAIEMAREKHEFDVVLKTQKDQAEQDKLKEQKRQEETEIYRKALLQQINQKERERIQAKQDWFEEGVAMKLEEECHKRQIKDLMIKKVHNLRSHDIPETYVKELETKVHCGYKRF